MYRSGVVVGNSLLEEGVKVLLEESTLCEDGEAVVSARFVVVRVVLMVCLDKLADEKLLRTLSVLRVRDRGWRMDVAESNVEPDAIEPRVVL